LGEYSLSGAIFLDSANSRDFTDFNSIFYGHHMEKQAMFGDLGLFSGREYFNERPYGNLYFGGRDHGIEFFAYLHVDAYDWPVFTPAIKGAEARQAYLDGLYEKATHTRDIGGVTAEDQIVLLTTCSSSSTNGRDILAGRLTDALFEDTFASNVTDEQPPAATVDRPGGGWWTNLPLWAWGALAALLVLLALAFIYTNKGRKRQKGVNQYGHDKKIARRKGDRAWHSAALPARPAVPADGPRGGGRYAHPGAADLHAAGGFQRGGFIQLRANTPESGQPHAGGRRRGHMDLQPDGHTVGRHPNHIYRRRSVPLHPEPGGGGAGGPHGGGTGVRAPGKGGPFGRRPERDGGV
jgi:hypothetical protein